jgi:hypothetical protein
MKISTEKKIVELRPENEQETKQLEKLWRMLIDCVGSAKKLAPIGEYIPSKNNAASFYIEGFADDDGRTFDGGAYYCSTCNKTVTLKPGDEIPLCCGRPMQSVD